MDVTSEANMGACPGAKTKKNNYSISEDNFSSTWKPQVAENFIGADIYFKGLVWGLRYITPFRRDMSALSISHVSIVTTIVW